MAIDLNTILKRHHRRIPKTLCSGIALAGLLVGGVSAVGAAVPKGGAIQVFVTPRDDGTGPIVITGAIGDFGQTLSIDKNGKTDPNGNYVKITLKKGTFEVDSTALNTAANKMQPTMTAATCSGSGSVTGSVTLLNGTGLYKGIAGTLHIIETFAFIGPMFASGAKKGQCNMSQNSQPLAQYAAITGTGIVTFR